MHAIIKNYSTILVKLFSRDALEVPANVEIVIEGKILPGKRAQDCPFLDYTGMPNINPGASIFEATCVMQRNNPIFGGAAIGPPGLFDSFTY